MEISILEFLNQIKEYTKPINWYSTDPDVGPRPKVVWKSINDKYFYETASQLIKSYSIGNSEDITKSNNCFTNRKGVRMAIHPYHQMHKSKRMIKVVQDELDYHTKCLLNPNCKDNFSQIKINTLFTLLEKLEVIENS